MTEPPARPASQPTRRHRSFPVGEVDSETLKHTDECLVNVRRFGFCEHEMLPLAPHLARPRPFRERHPWRYEILTTAGLAGVLAGNLVMVDRLGWWGVAVISVVGLGWLVVYALGLPEWATMDPRSVLPKDARERLERDR